MKGFFVSVMLLAGISVFANSPDTTVTSFEIHFKKRSSDYSPGFNSCSLDRLKLYNSVMQKIQKKMAVKNLRSLQQPLVTLKFHEYTDEKDGDQKVLTAFEKQAIASHNYNYYVKICGHLNPSTPLNPFTKATFTLKVFVFDSKGNLIASSKGKADRETINDFYKTTDKPISEEQFISFVSKAASKLNIRI